MLLVACGDESTTLTVPTPDAAQFELEVYPVLLRDCGFPACHGDTRRFFRVFGPGRTRFAPDTPLFDPATAVELEQSYQRARSMLANEGDITDSLLVRTPLAKSAGGGFHRGYDNWGRNVYASPLEPGYQAILKWAVSVGAGVSKQGAR